MMIDKRLSFPHVLRNREPILSTIRKWLPDQGTIIEVASGSGEHIVYFGRQLPHLQWQPTEIDPSRLASIQSWCEQEKLSNILPPKLLDAAHLPWQLSAYEGLINMNMIHIAPWKVTEGLMQGAAQILPSNAPLILYGPFFVDDQPAAPSNLKFHQDLQARDPSWGIRTLSSIDQLAAASAFEREACVTMPANNLCLLYRKS